MDTGLRPKPAAGKALISRRNGEGRVVPFSATTVPVIVAPVLSETLIPSRPSTPTVTGANASSNRRASLDGPPAPEFGRNAFRTYGPGGTLTIVNEPSALD